MGIGATIGKGDELCECVGSFGAAQKRCMPTLSLRKR